MSDNKAAQPITDFLEELDERESLITLQNACAQRSVFVFKTDADEKIVTATIDSFIDKKVILKLENLEVSVGINTEVSIKFNIGTEVYFVKTSIKQHHSGLYCFGLNAKVIQLKRREEPRYLIPKKYAQTAFIADPASRYTMIPCTVIDISVSGIRLEVKETAELQIRRDELLKIKFQIHRRAEVQCEAIVQFFMSRPKQSTLLGLELVFTSEIQRERVLGIVDDIISFQNGKKF